MEAGAFKMLQQAQPIEHEALGCRSCGSDGLKRLLVIVGVDPCLMEMGALGRFRVALGAVLSS